MSRASSPRFWTRCCGTATITGTWPTWPALHRDASAFGRVVLQPGGMDPQGRLEYRRLGQVLQRPHHLRICKRALAGAALFGGLISTPHPPSRLLNNPFLRAKVRNFPWKFDGRVCKTCLIQQAARWKEQMPPRRTMQSAASLDALVGLQPFAIPLLSGLVISDCWFLPEAFGF